MSELPSEWKIKALGDVVEKIVGGGTPSKNNASYFRGNIPFMTVKDMKTSRPKGTIDNITEEALENSSSKLIEPNTLIISTRMGLGKIVKVKFPVAINQDLKALYLSDDVYQKFFEYQYQYKAPEIEALGTGTTVKGIRLETLKKIEMVFAPLEEQKRIADKLDSVLAKVEAAQARLDKIPAILKRFRQSVLAAATSGELTKEWRGNEKYRDETLNWSITKIPESWDLKFLEEVAESRLGKMLDKSKNSGIATEYLGNINLRWHHIDLSELKEILVSQKEIDELNIRDGDLLLCEGGEPGRGAVWKGGDNNLVFQKAIHRVRCTDCISPEFLLYCIEDDFFSNRLSLLYTGTTIKHLTGKALKKYPVRIPPIAEQMEIVRRVNSLLEASSKIEEQYLAAKLRVNQLTQSILKKAFEGELLTSEVENEFLQELSDVEAVEC